MLISAVVDNSNVVADFNRPPRAPKALLEQ